jgi:TPR repeat protein
MYALGAWLQEGLVDDRGTTVAKPAPKKAVDWLERAANHSHPTALHELAYCYDMGLGVQADRAEAIKLYRRAIRAGEPLSAVNLAICYREDGNIRAYRHWIERGAESESTEAILQFAEWRLSRRTTTAQKKQAVKALRTLVRRIKGDRHGYSYYPDELPRAERLLDRGKLLGL